MEKHNLAMSYFEQGSQLMQQNKHQEAIVSFEKVLKIEPDNPSAKANIHILKNRIQPTDDNSRMLLFVKLFNDGKLSEARDIAKEITDTDLRNKLLESVRGQEKINASKTNEPTN